MKRIHIVSHIILATLLLFGSSITFAGIPVPTIPKGKGDACVKPTTDMRQNHMDYIQHKRDETMHEGIRTDISDNSYSFKDCMDCHAVNDEGNNPVNHKDDRHFCNSCHTYTAVNIDCFECHASTPSEEKSANNDGSIIKKMFNSIISAPVE